MQSFRINGIEVFREGPSYPPTKTPPPSFVTLRGWRGEWDENKSLLVCVNANKSSSLAILVTLDCVQWVVELLLVEPLTAPLDVVQVALDTAGLSWPGIPQDKTLEYVVQALVDFGFVVPLVRYYSSSPRAAVALAQAESARVVESFAQQKKVA